MTLKMRVLTLTAIIGFNFKVSGQTQIGSSPIYYLVSGNVGIGTTSPSTALDINGTFSSTSTGHRLAGFAGSGVYYLGTTTNSDLGIISNGGEVIRVSANGNVGIGTTSIGSYKLSVVGGDIKASGDTYSGIAIGSEATDRPRIGFHVSDNSRRFKMEVNDINTSNERVGIFTMNSGAWPETEAFSVSHDGKVGIGTTTPGAALSIKNSSPIVQLFDADGNPGDGSSIGKVAFGSILGEFASIEATRVNNNADDVTAIKFRTSFATGAGGDGNNLERMRIDYNGNVAIGTTDPRGFKLAVAGNMVAEQVNVMLKANWPDYVFNKRYNLLPLSALKSYIDKNHHLPEVPSAQEVTDKGLNLGEMNKILVKKVEELTLYLIEKDKKEKEQEEKMKNQQEQINMLKEQVALILKK